MFASLFSKTNLAITTAEEIIDQFVGFFENSLQHIEMELRNCSQRDDYINCFQKAAFEITNSLKAYNTKQKLETGLKQTGFYSKPKNFLLKEGVVQILGELEVKQSHGVIMPIKSQIQNFLGMPNVFQEIKKNQDKPRTDGVFQDLIDGELWKKIKRRYEGKHVIPLYLYTDEFQPDSGISAHSTDQKLAAFYYSFPSLPDYLANNLKCIFVAALLKCADVSMQDVDLQEYDPAVYALYEVLSDFERNGVEITVNDKIERVYIVLPQFLGDNLSLNSSLGFLRGFTAKYICRICILPKQLREMATKEQLEYLRNKDNYEQCLRGNPKCIEERKGVKNNCILNFLYNYKVYENFSVDMMHDCFLGVFKQDLSAVLNHYILETNTFSLDDFNQAKSKFDYGRKDIGNKTANILDSHLKNGLQMNAKEIWTLVEYLPLILKNLVPDYRNNRVFKFSLIMADLLDYLTRSTYSVADISALTAKIEEHHQMYLELFRNTPNISNHLTPKFHFMVHYGRIIKLTGPLKKTMVFRFEQKHQELKQYSRACYSRVNLPVSLCNKFCLVAAQVFLSKKNIFCLIKDVSYKPWGNLLGRYSMKVSMPMTSLRFKAVSYVLGDIIFFNNNMYKIEEMVQDLDHEDVLLFSRQLICELFENLGFYRLMSQCDVYETIRASELQYAPTNIHKVGNESYLKIKYF